MASFPELRAFRVETGSEPLQLPIGGRVYSFGKQHLTISAGLDLVTMREELARFTSRIAAGEVLDLATELNTPLLDPQRERSFMLELIGQDNRRQMEADGVLWPELQHVGHTLLTWHLTGVDAAMIVWTEGRTGDADPPTRPG